MKPACHSKCRLVWQIIHHGWDEFQTHYEQRYRKTQGPLRSDAIKVVEKFYTKYPHQRRAR